MTLDRRAFLQDLGTLAAGSALVPGAARTEPPNDGVTTIPAPGFPRKADFRIAEGYTYISGAYTHPMPIAAAEAYHRVVDPTGVPILEMVN